MQFICILNIEGKVLFCCRFSSFFLFGAPKHFAFVHENDQKKKGVEEDEDIVKTHLKFGKLNEQQTIHFDSFHEQNCELSMS